MAVRPLCFVLMPFGDKKDPSGGPDIPFDAVYEKAIRPAIEDAGLEPIRADEERTGGIIHKAMFERLLLCDFAVADLTTANANVFYELGVRHAVRPATTLPIFADTQRPLFDVNYLRALPYQLGKKNQFKESSAAKLRKSLGTKLKKLRKLARDEGQKDSPVFQLLKDYKAPKISRLKTDSFRDRARYEASVKRKLAKARDDSDAKKLKKITSSLGELDGVEIGILVDVFLSHRALKSYDAMLTLYKRFPVALRRSIMVREQLAFAQNRLGKRKQAIRTLESLIKEHGATSENCGLLGRVYKDLWVEARESSQDELEAGYLDRAIDTYVRGFEADWRDAYPGINAVTLLDIKGDDESLTRQTELLPVVRFSVNQRLKQTQPDYWDHATLLELSVLDHDAATASQHLATALTAVREPWEPETTANNLKLIRDARRQRGTEEAWLDQLIDALEQPVQA